MHIELKSIRITSATHNDSGKQFTAKLVVDGNIVAQISRPYMGDDEVVWTSPEAEAKVTSFFAGLEKFDCGTFINADGSPFLHQPTLDIWVADTIWNKVRLDGIIRKLKNKIGLLSKTEGLIYINNHPSILTRQGGDETLAMILNEFPDSAVINHLDKEQLITLLLQNGVLRRSPLK